MRLSPRDVRNVFHYKDGVLIGVEMRHASGESSGVCNNLDDADQALRRRLALDCYCGDLPPGGFFPKGEEPPHGCPRHGHEATR